MSVARKKSGAKEVSMMCGRMTIEVTEYAIF
jgi:hypothetical protein